MEWHISVPTLFAGLGLGLTPNPIFYRFQQFKNCSTVNRCDGATKALKLPTLLEGETLTIWMDLSAEDKDNWCRSSL